MKKVIFGVLVILFVSAFSLMIVRANGIDQDEYGYGYCHGGFGVRYDDYTYEMIYNHLSSDDQLTMDILLADRISAVDMSTMTDTEKQDTIDQIKEDLVDYMIDNYSYIGDYFG